MDAPRPEDLGLDRPDGPIDYTTFLDAIEDYGILLFDDKALIQEWNRGAERIFKWTREEMLGQDGHILFTPEDRENGEADGELRKAREEGKAPDERWHVKKGGERFWASGILYCVRGRKGVRGYVKVLRDFSEKKQAAAALLESERKLEFFMENMEDHALFLVNPHGQIASWNRGAERLFGHAGQEVLGRPLGILFTREEEAAEGGERELAEALRRGKHEAERWQRRKDGSLFWAATVTMPLIDAEEQLRGYARVTRDASTRHRAEEAQRMESIGRLAGGVAHDFNNMLTAINGYAELLLSCPRIDNEAREWIKEIRTSGSRAASLTRQLLAFGRRQMMAPRAVQLNEVIRETTPLLRRALGEDIRILNALDPDLEKVRVDPAQFEQVILSMALNSREAMPAGGEIVIETSNAELGPSQVSEKIPLDPGPCVLLRFRDTGKGMDSGVLGRVFEPFFTTKPKGAGSSGMGLSMVYGVVRQSGGAITAESEPGHGAEFRIYLPVAREDREPAPLPHLEREARKGIMLVVEDEPSVRRLTAELLSREGWRPAEASDGAEALAWIEAHPHEAELLLTDVVMPTMGGIELAARVRALEPDLPILFMSGYTEEAVFPEGGPAGSADFLQKPFTIRDLVDKVRGALARTVHA